MRKTTMVDDRPAFLRDLGFTGSRGQYRKHVGIVGSMISGDTAYAVVVTRMPFGAPWRAETTANGTVIGTMFGSDIGVASDAVASVVKHFGPFG